VATASREAFRREISPLPNSSIEFSGHVSSWRESQKPLFQMKELLQLIGEKAGGKKGERKD